MPPHLALRPPSWEQAREGAKGFARHGVRLVERSDLASRAVVSLLAARAAHHGAPPVLLARGDTLRREAPLRTTVSFHRLLVAVSKTGVTRLASLLRHVRAAGAREDEMWAAFSLAGLDVSGLALADDREHLVRRAAAPVEHEIATTGVSTLFDWLVRNDVYRLDDEAFRRAIDQVIRRSIAQRRSDATWTASDDLLDARRSMIATISGIGEILDEPVFATGSTLRDAMTGRFDSDPASMELGTFGSCTDLATAAVAAGLRIERSDTTTLVVSDEARIVRAHVGRYVRYEATVVYSDGALSRWHEPFDTVDGVVDGTSCAVPSDVPRYLTERFGPTWETAKLFFDDVFDSPNSTSDDSLTALFDISRRVRDSFATGDRFVASESSRRLRDRFGIDHTRFVPQPVHHKVLSIPLRDRPVSGSTTTVIAGGFELLDATTLRGLQRVAADDRIVVAAVRDTPGSDLGVERMTTVKTLRSIDHVMLYDSTSELIAGLREIDADELLIRPDAGFRADDVDLPGVAVTDVRDENGDT